jgi:hypothetical protein
VDLPTVGASIYRSGWPYAISALKCLSEPNGQWLVDDYIERTFLFPRYLHLEIEHRRPWIGFVHHPPELPEWYSQERLQNLSSDPRWCKSLGSLRLAVTFAPHVARWVSEEWKIPTLTLWHPSEPSPIQWSERYFLETRPVSIVQIGTFGRNLTAIDSVQVPSWMSKSHLHQHGEPVVRAEAVCREYYGVFPDPSVNHLRQIDNDGYDFLLSRSIVFLSLIASAANNTILECIRRHVPVIVNRIAGPTYYLGEKYPLFYERLEDVRDLLTEDNILAAHRYMKQRSCMCVGAEDLAQQVGRAINNLAP